MHSKPSCTSTCCINICGRASYGQECRNMSMVRSSLGPFPDEWILSGLDKILYFCGIKNVCELVEKIPGSSDYYLSSSYSDSDECLSLPKSSFRGGQANRISQSVIEVDSKDNIVRAKNVSIVTLPETEGDEKVLEKTVNDLQRSVSMVQQSLGNDLIDGKRSSIKQQRNANGNSSKNLKASSKSLKKSLSEVRDRSVSKLSESKRSKSNLELTKSSTLNISDLKISNNESKKQQVSFHNDYIMEKGNGKLKTLYTSAELKASGIGVTDKMEKALDELLGNTKDERNQVAELPRACPSSPSASTKRGKYANLSPRQQQKLPRIIGTRWAMARINIFSDCSRTYEILEIKGRLPQAVIPCKTVVFFAVLPDGSTICYDYIKAKKRR